MNYEKHYNNLCERAKSRTLNGYTEKHHIIPVCMGGSNEAKNLVNLTPEEHYVSHQLLVKMYPNNQSLIYAANKMTVSSKNHFRRNNKQYGWLKRKFINICKKRTGDKNGSFGRRWYYNPDTLENIKCFPEDVPEGFVKGRKIQTSYVRTSHRPNTLCVVCGTDTGTKRRKYCDTHLHEFRKEHAKKTVDKAILHPKHGGRKYSDEDIRQAILRNDGKLENAMLSLGYVVGNKGNNTWKRFERINGSLV